MELWLVLGVHQTLGVHGISQARILEWVVMPSSSISFQPRDRNLGCLLRWQADSLPLSHQGSPYKINKGYASQL